MKKVSGTLKLDQAQYRELEAFAKFGSDLDAATMNVIGKGERNVELLKQGVHAPVAVEEQVAFIYAGTNGLLKKVPVNQVREWQVDFLELLRNKHADTLTAIRLGKWTDEIMDVLKTVISETTSKY